MSININTRRILFDETISSSDIISKILKKKREGILKNQSILNEKNSQIDDLFSEQMLLISLNRNETYTRKKTLKTFQKNLFEEIYKPLEKKIPNILKKQSSLKEILISSKKLKMTIEENKRKREPYVITDLWSNKYYRKLLKHSKLDSLIKETEKEKIWRTTKQRALLNLTNSKDQTSSILTMSPIIPNNDFKKKSLKNIEPNKIISGKEQKKNAIKLPSLNEIINFDNIIESGVGEEKIAIQNIDKKKIKRYRSVDKLKFYNDANSSLNQIINDCDENKKDFQKIKE